MGPALPTSLHACIYFPSFACCNLLNNFSAYTSPHLLQLGCRGTLPNDPVPESALEDEGFLKQFHHALLEVRGIVRAVYCIQPGELNSHFASLYCEMAIPRLDPRCASNYTRFETTSVHALCKPNIFTCPKQRGSPKNMA
eukprot:scaffold20456_cov22-Tisochrysis_lutea.AAC.1